MNRKKILMTSLLVILMVLLVFSQKVLDNSFKEVAFLDNDMRELKEHYVDVGKIIFKMPDEWIINEKQGNEYIIYNAEFKDNKNKVRGFMEVLNSSEDIKSLAQKDMNNLPLAYSNEKIEGFKVNDLRGIKMNYNTNLSKGKECTNSVYYLKIDDKRISRFTFIVSKENYKDSMKSIFDTLVSSVKVNS